MSNLFSKRIQYVNEQYINRVRDNMKPIQKAKLKKTIWKEATTKIK